MIFDFSFDFDLNLHEGKLKYKKCYNEKFWGIVYIVLDGIFWE